MKFLNCIYLFCFLVSLNSFSQDENKSGDENTNSYLTINLTPIADPFSPRVRLGYTQHLADHWKLGLDLGYGNDATAVFLTVKQQTVGVDYSLWEVRPELHYIFNPNARTIKYISAELFYIDQSGLLIDTNFQDENGTNFRFDQADFSRQKYGLNIKYGLFLNVGKNLGFNFYGGLGVRFRNNKFTNVVNQRAEEVFREYFLGTSDVEGKAFGLNTTLGWKFYYKF